MPKIVLALLALLAALTTSANVAISDLSLDGKINGENLRYTLSFTATAAKPNAEIAILGGHSLLTSVPDAEGWHLHFSPARSAYLLHVDKPNVATPISVSFLASSQPVKDDESFREIAFPLPAAQQRAIAITVDDGEVDVKLPGCLRVATDALKTDGLLQPGKPFSLRWKGRVEIDEDAELLVASEANTILTLSPGSLRLDALYVYSISQGKLRELRFAIPAGLSITQVRGDAIRDWQLLDLADDGNVLQVELSREQTDRYGIQLLGESALPALPTEVDLPVIRPLDGNRAEGYLAFGTASAIQLSAKDSTGVTQIDGAAFPRIVLSKDQPRPIPAKSAYYSFAATPYQLTVGLVDIVPSFDVEHRTVIAAKDDDLIIKSELEFDVRDAPIRRIEVNIPAPFVVADVKGAQVADYAVNAIPGANKVLAIDLKTPIMGQTVFNLQLELTQSPLGIVHQIGGFTVNGARSERGFISITAEQGVLVEKPTASNMRQVHTGSTHMRVPNAEFAFRFREADWSLELDIKDKPASIRAEAFHLLSLGDGVAYGSVALTYFISGAPVDELRFQIDPSLHAVEFTGLDVAHWSQAEDTWTVKLRRKVIDDYNLGISFSQRYEDGDRVLTGGVRCLDVETETGFMAITGRLNAQLDAAADPSLIPITTEEIPDHYRLLILAPVLDSYKFVSTPHTVSHKIAAFATSEARSVVVEFIRANTTLSLSKKGEAESRTTVQYTLKNSSAQFLDLQIPQGQGLNIWSVHEDGKRVPASEDNGILKIPLERSHNPNAPTTIVLQYGQVHGKLPLSGKLALTLPPNTEVPATFAEWTLTGPEGWTLKPGAGSMGANHVYASKTRGLPDLIRALARAWGDAGERLCGFFMALIISVFIMLLARQRIITRIAIAIALLSALAISIEAAGRASRYTVSQAVNGIQYSQVLNVDKPLSIAAHALPVWREHLSAGTTVLGIIILVGGLWFAYRQEQSWLRRLLCITALFGFFIIAAQFRAGQIAFIHLMTWGLPVLLLLRLAGWRLLNPYPALPAIVACALFAQSELRANPPVPVIDSASATLVAETTGTMDVTLELGVSNDRLLHVPVAPESAILLDRPTNLITLGGQHLLTFPAGTHKASVRFLLPLPGADATQTTRFELPLPTALTNMVHLTVPKTGMQIDSPHKIRIDQGDVGTTTEAVITLLPGKPASLSWTPRERRSKEEKTVFYSDTVTLSQIDNGVVESHHRLNFRIAQGKLRKVTVRIPENMSVNRVVGDAVATWRFEPATSTVLVQFGQPVSGDYPLLISTQIAANTMPYTATIRPLQVEAAERQRGSIGLINTSRVLMSVTSSPRVMNIGDFTRAASGLLKQGVEVPHAYRFSEPDAAVSVSVSAVTPELRVTEVSSLGILDDRLVFTADFAINIAKAGRFDVELELPTGYDIDNLSGDHVSHWDELDGTAPRRVRVLFNSRLLGATKLNLALSQSVATLPESIPVPRVAIADVLKHSGQLIVSVTRGVRLSIADRQGVSELDPATLGLRDKPALAFKLLRPDWQLTLGREVLTPRINVDFLHVAHVSDGLVRHRQFRRYHLHNAGTKTFDIDLPEDALGLSISGKEIARKERIDEAENIWRIELARKWFDGPYHLRINYETRFDISSGQVPIKPINSVGADLQRGHVVVHSTNRVELDAQQAEAPLQTFNAREVPRIFSAGDLSDAPFCYTSPSAGYVLSFRATRHKDADLLTASVTRTQLDSVVNRQGDTINSLEMDLQTTSRRHLRCKLPETAQIWSLLVDQKSQRLSYGADGRLLVPLPQATDTAVAVNVKIIYVIPNDTRWRAGGHAFDGPQFDLPLRNITWSLYLPEGWEFDDFEGTMTINESTVAVPQATHYSEGAYRSSLTDLEKRDNAKAKELQQQSLAYQRKGNQKAARYALDQARNYSQADAALYEDAHVEYRNLVKQQAIFGLANRRGVANKDDVGQGQQVKNFTSDEAERLQSSLSKTDSLNLDAIAGQFLDVQEVASAMDMQLMINMPKHGRELIFTRDLQVQANAPMQVSFRAAAVASGAVTTNWGLVAALIIAFTLITALIPKAAHGIDTLHSQAQSNRAARSEARRVAKAERMAASMEATTWDLEEELPEPSPEVEVEAEPEPEAEPESEPEAEAEADPDPPPEPDTTDESDEEVQP